MTPSHADDKRLNGVHHTTPSASNGTAVVNNNQGGAAPRGLLPLQIRRSIADVDIGMNLRDTPAVVHRPDHFPRCFGNSRYVFYPPTPWVNKADNKK
ncbi:hypothetical protein AAVH_05992 [Aphelenchoides avenae]|nr:hypothetical protein AAVH_05992 [Aphelenchus avenae]